MLAVKGYIDSGRFTPTDGAKLPAYAHAVLVVDISTPQSLPINLLTNDKTARNDWLNQLRQARQLAKNDPMPDFVVRQPMREPHGLTD
ncbi:MAG: hypothetical protein FWF77_03020 [Defluviitaleaceae bacterium]|nr:hypothetical protein [Defluviitaleaceae bacterium]